jgi:hypothetical protein
MANSSCCLLSVSLSVFLLLSPFFQDVSAVDATFNVDVPSASQAIVSSQMSTVSTMSNNNISNAMKTKDDLVKERLRSTLQGLLNAAR